MTCCVTPMCRKINCSVTPTVVVSVDGKPDTLSGSTYQIIRDVQNNVVITVCDIDNREKRRIQVPQMCIMYLI